MKAMLSEFIDHTLHWRTRRSLEAHLADCPPCRLFLRSVETTITLCRKRPQVDVPSEVRGHLRELLRDRHEKKKRAAARKPRTAGSRRA